ncbi:DUF4865 family protein [Amycolatopsis magusensis]|uniref:DUF4865 family protein n=1 Tax=Amycolatopsis magusensis TaxID=882444 RepID=UPI003C2F56D9
MQAMQYEITLPADYDMGLIRHRVATRGSALDAFDGLGFKAYCVRERGVHGSPVNQYAPFYWWDSAEAMNRFLWGDGFRGLCDSFGRPPIAHWLGIEVARGPARRATTAIRTSESIVDGQAPADAVADAQFSVADSVYATVLAVDLRRWELTRFTLYDGEPPVSDGIRYQVLHLSDPGHSVPASSAVPRASAAS